MAKNFNELRKKMSPESRERSEQEARRLVAEMPLQKLRHARQFTQEGLAKALDVNQSEISKIEKRADMYVSTLASYIRAMGGDLEIRAVFPDGDPIRITQFEKLAGEEA
jgi:transcriptional regulator with XRE-family HTH domain